LIASLSDIVSDCALCGQRELFTGKTVQRGDGLYAVLRCCGCGSEGPVRSQRFEPAIQAYLDARERLKNPSTYDRAWASLQSKGENRIARLIQSLDTSEGIRELPFFRFEHVSLPGKAEVIEAWAEAALDYSGFRPLPNPCQRFEEALALAVHFDRPSCAAAAATRLGDLDDQSLDTVLRRLPARFGGARSGRALKPFFDAIYHAGGPRAASLARSREDWAIAELRDAAAMA
jgi:hypothetical protein